MGTTLSLHGRVVNKNGSALSGKTVKLYDVTNPSSPVEIPSAATVTDANGYFAITNQDDTKPYRVVVEYSPTSNLVAVRERFSAQMRNLQVWDRLHVRSGAVVSIETDATVNRSLTVGGTTASGQAKVYVYDTDQVVIYTEQATNSNASANLSFNKARGTIPGRAAVQSGDELFTISGSGWDGSGYRDSVKVVATVDGTPGANDMPGKLAVLTSPDGSANPVERFSVKNTGEVIANRSLTVGGTTTSGQAKVYVYDDDVVKINIEQATNNNLPANLYFNRERGTVANKAAIQNGDYIFSIRGAGWDGTAYRDAVAIEAVAGVPGSNAVPGSLSVSTRQIDYPEMKPRLLVSNTGEVTVLGALIVGGDTTGVGYRLHIYDQNQVTIRVEQRTNNSAAPNLSFEKARGSTTTLNPVVNGDEMFVISGSGYDGNTYLTSASINAIVDGNVSQGNVPSRIEIKTSTAGSGMRTQMRINEESIGFRQILAASSVSGLSGVLRIRKLSNNDVIGYIPIYNNYA
jgi:hypothetical protein